MYLMMGVVLIWMKMYHIERMSFLPQHHLSEVFARKKKEIKNYFVLFEPYFRWRWKLTGVNEQMVSCWVFQLSHVDRTITCFWKLKFLTFTVPITIDSFSLTITFSSETLWLSNLPLFFGRRKWTNNYYLSLFTFRCKSTNSTMISILIR